MVQMAIRMKYFTTLTMLCPDFLIVKGEAGTLLNPVLARTTKVSATWTTDREGWDDFFALLLYFSPLSGSVLDALFSQMQLIF